MSTLAVESVLGPSGELSRSLKGYEHRPAQLALSRAVTETLESGGFLLAEAGTGTGKSLAYLVPAMLSEGRVVISTTTRHLQEQLLNKDIPALKALGLSKRVALLKGRQNYLCLHRFEAFDRRPDFLSPDDARPYEEFRDWARDTATGDQSESNTAEDWPVWRKVSVNADGCLGRTCPQFLDCHANKARTAASEAHVIIVNHALLLSDLSLRTRAGTEDRRILPAYDAVILDEAHGLEDAATEHFSTSLSGPKLSRLAGEVEKLAPGLASSSTLVTRLSIELRAATNTLFNELLSARQRSATTDWVPLVEAHPQFLTKLSRVNEALDALAGAISDDSADAKTAKRRLEDAGADAALLLEAKEPGVVFWVRFSEHGASLHAAPIEAGRLLSERLSAVAKSVVLTSATLTSAGKGAEPSFEFLVERLGLTQSSPRTLRVDSPFDYAKNAALYLPKHLPEPNAPEYLDAFVTEAEALVELTGGRAFLLFTSLKAMQGAHARLSSHLGYPALLQGSAPRAVLLEKFRAKPSVLFASHAFWEGVDVAGEALSLVVVDRLPFAPPDDPLQAARCRALEAEGIEPFSAYQVPRAALALKQGFGRLIRTATDRGIMALLDVRATKKRYGKAFLDTLPPAQRVHDWEALEAFWQRGSKRRR